jgi:universal stress protein E
LIVELTVIMRSIRTIIVPIRDYSARSQPAVTKAAQLAKALSANVELFHNIAATISIETPDSPGDTLKGIKAGIRRAALEGLERIAAPLRTLGITVTTSTAWDYPPHEAIVRRAIAIKADFMVVPRRDRHRLPALLRYTDWELLRSSPVPVLLVKMSAPYRRPVILAAIDPTHAHAKPSALDQRIIDYGMQVSRALRGALHVVHAYLPEPLPPSVTFDMERRKILRADSQRNVQKQFDDALTKQRIPSLRRHLVPGNPAAVIPATARKTHSAIVVIGAVSRSALARLFIGSTAESVIDSLRCDLLVIKPAKIEPKRRAIRRVSRLASPSRAV